MRNIFPMGLLALLHADLHVNDTANQEISSHQMRAFASVARNVTNASTVATRESARTSPQRCLMCSGLARACAAMTPACTTLDQTVNHMRLRCASGWRLAINKKIPKVA